MSVSPDLEVRRMTGTATVIRANVGSTRGTVNGQGEDQSGDRLFDGGEGGAAMTSPQGRQRENLSRAIGVAQTETTSQEIIWG
jgi:hypothetical protein